MKRARRIILYVCLALGVIIISLALSVFLFKERIIKQFITEANKQLNTPIKVGKIDVTVFQHFPKLSIVLKDVYVEDSFPDEYPLMTAKQVAFLMNPFEVWSGTYNITGLTVEDSETSLRINTKGKNNYTILKEEQPGSSGSINFELSRVTLKKTKFVYVDHASSQQIILHSSKLHAAIKTQRDVYYIHADGDVTTDKINVSGGEYSVGKSFNIDSDILYHDIEKRITIKPSDVHLKTAAFAVSGQYQWKEKSEIDLQVEGKNADIQTLISLLPESLAGNVEKYKSNGDVYFNGKLKGEISSKRTPSVSIDFGFKNATIYHPEYKSRIEGATLTGSYASTEITSIRNATLVLKNVSGKLNNEPFTSNLVVSNFEDPEVIFSFKGMLDAASLHGFYPVESIANVKGRLNADVAISGKLQLLKSKATAQWVNTSGTIDLENIQFIYGKNKVPVRDLGGSLQFSNNDLALSNVGGTIGKSDFLLNGFFKNVITYLLFDNQPVGIETDLKAKYLDINELFQIGYGGTGNASDGVSDDFTFRISPHVYLNFNCDVRSLKYKRFHAQHLKGDLLVKNQVSVSRQLSLKTMGGDLTLSGIVDATNPKVIDVVCSSKLNGMHLDSVFYVFENFDQDFILDKHLKGNVTATVDVEMSLKPNLRLYPETLIADIKTVIKNGQLNNFEPMKKLNKYLDDEGLSKLRFADLQNDIHIEKKTVYIPQMTVRSNVTTIQISGTHTFDQQIEYRLIAPLRGNKNLTDKEAISAMENDGSGQTKLFLKIVGTTENYRIVYDTDAVRKKISNDLKKEVQELKDAFKNKGTQKKKELEVQQDEYFDW